ncbi:tetratricopeptide repeat protein [Sphingomonas sp. RP10(2022)]|uniref:Tetratricopeptide repeat protein n=1 Tax=Sphingomonas liriopis TaxID=2949094 RepID=A0A9X2HS24_9SPHN|nr:tetratricopeptide repeat protein [Sphingomonas liriopis]MCP3735467.1 tetratricopeptide repeat protein [Sphingomonas liriopis]
MRVIVAAMLAGACLTTPALAADRTGYQAIVAGDFSAAVTRIEAERRIFPDRPELMLNLAVAYAQTGRTADARALYRVVLDRPGVAMDMPNGAVLSSHDVATRGLSRLTTTIATR